MYFTTEGQIERLEQLGWAGDRNEFSRAGQNGFLVPRIEANTVLESSNLNYAGANSGYDGIQILNILDVVAAPAAPPVAPAAPVAEQLMGTPVAVSAVCNEDRKPSEVSEQLEGVLKIEGPEQLWDGRGRMKYLKVVEEELKGIYSKVHVSVPNGEVELPKDITYDLNIRIWSSPKSNSVIGGPKGDLTPPEKLFGKPVLCRDEMFPESGVGIAIKDPESGLVLMEFVSPNYLYFTWDAVQKDAKASEHIFRSCLQLFKKEIGEDKLKDSVKSIAKKREEEQRKKLTSFVKEVMDKEFKEARSAIERISVDIDKFQSNLVLKIRERAAKMLMVETPEAENLDKRANKMIRNLYSLSHVINVEIKSKALHIHTDKIYVEDPRTKRTHELGCFRIEVDSGNNRNVKIYNSTRQIRAYERGMQAPHVFPDGRPCLGDLIQSLPEAQAKHDYSTIALLCILFLEHVNVADPAGKYVHYWPRVEKDGTTSERKDRPKEEQNIRS